MAVGSKVTKNVAHLESHGWFHVACIGGPLHDCTVRTYGMEDMPMPDGTVYELCPPVVEGTTWKFLHRGQPMEKAA